MHLKSIRFVYINHNELLMIPLFLTGKTTAAKRKCHPLDPECKCHGVPRNM